MVLLSAVHQNSLIHILYSFSFKLVSIMGKPGPRRGICHWTPFLDLVPDQIPKSKCLHVSWDSNQYNQQGLIQLLKCSYLVPFETQTSVLQAVGPEGLGFPMCLMSCLPYLCIWIAKSTNFRQLNWVCSKCGYWTLKMHRADQQEDAWSPPPIFTSSPLTTIGTCTPSLHVDT